MTSPSVILTEGKLQDAVSYLVQQDGFAFDVESHGLNRGIPHLNNISWISLASDRLTAVVPCGHPIGTKVIGSHKEPSVYSTGRKYMKNVTDYEDPPPQLSPATVFDIIRPLFFNPFITKVAHNATFDLASVAKYFGAVPSPPFDDTIVDAWLCDENRKRFGLKYLTKDIFHHTYDDEDVGRCVEKHPFDTVALYSYLDARYDWLLYRRLQPQIAKMDLSAVHDLESQIIRVLVDMRLNGARVDVPRLKELQVQLTDRLVDITGDVYSAAGRVFNMNSTAQKRSLLFDKPPDGQGLKPWKKTKGEQWSTDDEVLKSYPANPLASALREYGDTAKVLGTYVVGYLGDPKDPDKKPCRIFSDHVHADFVQYGTVSGRFSCREPNLQNIPRPDTALGKTIRGIWIADPGHHLVVADFGQIELVVLAHYLGQGKLYEGFHQGIDPHRMTAAMVLGKAPGEVTKDERQYLGKTLGFATVYGAGFKKVASMAQVSETRAREILAKHKEMFPEIYEFRDYLIADCRRGVPLRTLAGRIRRLPTINAADDGLRKYAERQAFNSLIQGGAADLQKIAMLRAYNDPRKQDIKMLMCVHDEIVLTSPDEQVPVAEDILREAMTGDGIQALITVPLTADICAVERWSEAK
jgi:DNA polymerase I-like protein with 3'-5' exonuclease and polymerase domains